MTARGRAAAGLAAALVATLVAGCAGDALGDPTPRLEKSPSTTLALVGEECERVPPKTIADLTGGGSAISEFIGALCRWTVRNARVVDVTFAWYEWNSLAVEQRTAKRYGYTTETIRINGQTAVRIRDPKEPTMCGVIAGAPISGTATWIVQPRGGGGDSCDAATTLMEKTITRSY